MLSARQKLLLVIGLAVVGAAVILRLRDQSAAESPSEPKRLPAPDNDGPVEQIVAAARRVWGAIPNNPWVSLLRSTEQALGIPDTLLTRMAWIESRFNPSAKNARSGATGIMQIVPSAHPGVKAEDPNQAIPYAGRFLKQLYSQFGSWDKAIAAYNWGPGNLQRDIAQNGANWRAGLPAETSNYLAQVGQVIDLPA